MRIIYNEDLNKRIIPYVDKLIKNKKKLDKETAVLFDVFIQYLDMDTRYGTYGEQLEPCITEIIREESIRNVAHLFDGKLNKLLLYLLGDEYAGLFHTYLKIKARCPYTCGYSRRSQRSVDPTLHLNHVTDALTQFLKLRATGFNEQAILNGGRTPEEIEQCQPSESGTPSSYRCQRIPSVARTGREVIVGCQTARRTPASYRRDNGRRLSRKLPLPIFHYLRQRTSTLCFRETRHSSQYRYRRTGQQ